MELNPHDVWAAHAVTHVLEMRAGSRDGIDWIKSTRSRLERRQLLRLPQLVAPGAASTSTARSRVGARGVRHARPPGAEPRRAAKWWMPPRCCGGCGCATSTSAIAGRSWPTSWEALGDDGYYAFNDVHAADGLSRAPAINARPNASCAALEAAARRRDTNGMMSREVGLPVARALCAFERQDYEITIDELQRVARLRHRFGGSHAQRDLLQLTATEAALRAGRRSLARALIGERLALKPRSEFNRQLLERTQVLGTDEDTRAA